MFAMLSVELKNVARYFGGTYRDTILNIYYTCGGIFFLLLNNYVSRPIMN